MPTFEPTFFFDTNYFKNEVNPVFQNVVLKKRTMQCQVKLLNLKKKTVKRSFF